ncbi:protein kinase domain-containing protein [Marinobacter nauticus]|nr:hypothetical protein [Marinobacter nauticus]
MTKPWYGSMIKRGSELVLTYPDDRKERFRLRGKPLNRGADGLIYAMPGKPLALKIYHEPEKDPERRGKIQQMLASPPDDQGLTHFAWPVALLTNSKGAFVGYAMPLLPMGDYVSLDLLLNRKGRELARLPESRNLRVTAAINLARRVAQLHARGHCIIDLKPANLLVHKQTGDVVVVDCDGFAIQGDQQFIPGHQYTTGYIAPEAWQRGASPEELGQPQDRFALAVIIFQLLNEGLHPYQGVPGDRQHIPSDIQGRIGENLYAYGRQSSGKIKPSPWSLHRDFPESIATAFHQSFRSVNHRPKAEDWVETLNEAYKTLRFCRKNRHHAFWKDNCPLCGRESVEIKVKKPQRRPERKRHKRGATTPNPYQQQLAQTIARAYQAQNNPPASAGNSSFFKVVSVLFAVFLAVGYTVHLYGEHTDRAERIKEQQRMAEANESKPESPKAPKPEPKSYGWREFGPRATGISVHQSKHTLPKSQALLSPAERRRNPPEPHSVPYFAIGSFESHHSIPMLSFSPSGPTSDLAVAKPASLVQLSAPASKFSDTGIHYPIGRSYRLNDWFVHPSSSALYARRCQFQMDCYELARLSRSGRESLITVSERPINDGSGRRKGIAPWYFAVTRDESRIIIAAPTKLLIYSVGSPEKPVATVEYPDDVAHLAVSDLAITPDGTKLFVALSRHRNFGQEYEANVLEFSVNGSEIDLTTNFGALWPTGGTIPAGSVEVSDDGDTLVIGDYRDLQDDNTTYTYLGSPINVKTALAGLTVWKRSREVPQWTPWKDIALPRRSPIEAPYNPASFVMSLGKMMQGDYRFNASFQLARDGSRLLSGIEYEHITKQQTIARAWVLDLQEPEPVVRYQIERTLNRSFRVTEKIAPFAKLSTNADQAIIGWASYPGTTVLGQIREMELALTSFLLRK